MQTEEPLNAPFVVNSDEGTLIHNERTFRSDGEEDEYWVPLAEIASEKLSRIPTGSSIVLTQKILGTNDFHPIHPDATYVNSNEHGLIIKLTIFIFEEEIDRNYFKEHVNKVVTKGEKSLAALFEDKTIIDTKCDVYEEL